MSTELKSAIKVKSYVGAKKRYLMSKEFKESEKILMDAGIKYPYCENILIRAFNEGYKAQK